MVDTAQLVAKVETQGVTRATKELDNFSATSKTADTNVLAFGQSSSKLTKQFALQKGAARQLGFQLQDVVVQLDAGTRASTVLAQQGSQIASVFGPGGALVGAFIATAAAIGGPFIASLFDSESAADKLTKALEDLEDIAELTDDGIVKLTKSLNSLTGALLIESIEDARDAIAAAREEALDFADSIRPSDFGGRFDALFLSVRNLSAQFKAGQIPLQAYREELDELFINAEERSKGFRDLRTNIGQLADQSKFAFETLVELRNAQDGVTESTNENQKSIDRLIASLEVQASALTDVNNGTAFYKAQQLDASEAELQRVQTLEQLIQKQKEQARAEAEAEREAARAAKAYEKTLEESLKRRRQLQQDFDDAELQSQQDFEDRRQSEIAKGFDNVTSLSSSKNKELFRISQAAAIAQATISGAAAIQNALATPPYPLGVALAAAAAVSTGANIAAIASQQPPSARQQGGQFRSGQDLLVGEKGPELVRFNSGGRIANNQDTQNLLNASAGPNITINNNAPNTMARAETLSTGDVVVIVEEVLNREVNQPNSNFNKSLSRTRNAPRSFA